MEKSVSEELKKKRQGILLTILAGFFFALMSFFVRLSGDLPTMEKAFFRNAVALIAAVVILARSEKKFYIQKSSWPSLLLRSLFGTLGLILNFYAVDRLNIADANILNKMSPFFAIIFSYFLVKEKANKVEWGCVILAFAGAVFIIKPSLSMEFVYALAGFAGGMFAGLAYAFVRKLGNMGERGPVIVFCFSAFSTIATLPFMILEWQPMTWIQLLCLLGAGGAATGGQLCITGAYTRAAAREISVYDYTQVLFAALLGILFLGQIPDWMSFVGYGIIIGSAVLKWIYINRRGK